MRTTMAMESATTSMLAGWASGVKHATQSKFVLGITRMGLKLQMGHLVWGSTRSRIPWQKGQLVLMKEEPRYQRRMLNTPRCTKFFIKRRMSNTSPPITPNTKLEVRAKAKPHPHWYQLLRLRRTNEESL
jgi:hypothetical protein